MEESLDVDDLFGDPNSLDLGLTASQPAKGLAQRLDEMRLWGCCKKIAWSKLGCIAYISQDGLQVMVRHLVCKPADGKWTLGDEHPQSQIAQLHVGQQLAHLCWNEMGNDLAVLDVSGRISVFSISTTLNNIAVNRQPMLDQPEDGAQVVGMMWMNANRAVRPLCLDPGRLFFAKLNERWNYSPFRRKPIGPFHPANKAALIAITRVGVVRLLYQNPDNRWTEISAELKTTNHSDRVLTHAALLPSPNGVIVATHSLSEKISLYRMQITWNPAQWDQAQQRQASGALNFPVPTIRTNHYKTEIPGRMFSSNKDQGDDLENLTTTQSSLYQLTGLELVSGNSDNTGIAPSAPWILAIYSSPLHGAVHNPQNQEPPSSVMVRWQLESSALNLHPVFEELIAKKTNGQHKTKLELRRLEDIYFAKYVVSIDYVEFGNVLAITHDDSSVSLFDPKTMSTLSEAHDVNTVTSMAQAGFRFPLDAPGLNVCFSPNGSLAVNLDAESQAQLRFAEYPFESGNDSHDNARNVFINEVYRALPINCNFSIEQDKSMQHPYIPRCLSMQAALGFQNYFTPRSLPSSVSWSILHLRHASLLFAFFFQYSKAPKESESPDRDFLRMVQGNTKWALDFTQYILDDLFALAKEFESVIDDQEAFSQKGSKSQINIIVASHSSPSDSTSYPFSGDGRTYSRELCALIDKAPVRFPLYEKFLSGLELAVKQAYQGAGFGDNERRTPEKDLLVNSRIPAVLIPVVNTLFKQTIPAIQSEIDQMTIYFIDYSWLGVCNDRRTEYYRRSRQVDVLKKIRLRGFSVNNNSTVNNNNNNNNSKDENQVIEPYMTSQLLSNEVTPGSLSRRRCIIRNCLCGGMWTFETGPPVATSRLDG
ncbi:Mediator of RNA polymerase II transcription subunit 16 [Talaromyces atroroseus]|uniref:Mediator of RNA polymerase II transcription subunit 16 n=1 Tax=Talaromyces atroroseus TaxID=1441469 RepID=A0A225AWY6_TALAT|nr:Mediator of RNA polymerase II transcription subunit 16 [Talaromyces atroroseus]OKL60129.1 Mediator of RNA polymerase II transcription subunit 16 [Talaromyces atroroseus]